MVLLSELCFTCSWEGPCHTALTRSSSVGLWMSFVMHSVDVFCDAACAVLQTALARISSVGLWMCFVMRPV